MTASDEAHVLALQIAGIPAEMAARIAALLASPPRFLLDGAARREVIAHQRRAAVHGVELAALRHRMAMDFGRARGWALTVQPFDVTALSGRRRVDHGRVVKVDWPHVYADGASRYAVGRRPMGLAGHLHEPSPGERHAAVVWAGANGLRASFPDFPSWQLPGRTALVLFEAAGGTAASGG